MNKELNVFARRKVLIGIILMCGLISMYEYFTVGFNFIGVFRVFIPVFWGAFTVVSFFCMATIKAFDSSKYPIPSFSDSKNNLIVFLCNVCSIVMMIYIYDTFNVTGMSVEYWSGRAIFVTCIICVLMFMYMVGAYRVFRCKTGKFKYPDSSSDDIENLIKGNSYPKTVDDVKPERSQSDVDVERELNSGDKYAEKINEILGRASSFSVDPVVVDNYDIEEDESDSGESKDSEVEEDFTDGTESSSENSETTVLEEK